MLSNVFFFVVDTFRTMIETPLQATEGQESVTETTVNPINVDTETKIDEDDDTAFPTLYVAVVFGKFH